MQYREIGLLGIFVILGLMLIPASNAFGSYSAIQDITTDGNSTRGLGFNDNTDHPTGSVITSNGVYFAWDQRDTSKRDLTFAFVDRMGVLRTPIVIDSTTVDNTMIWQDIMIFADGNTIDIITTKENGTSSHYTPTHYRSIDDGVNWSTGHQMVSSTQAGGNGIFIADPIWADVDGDDMVMIYNDRDNPAGMTFEIRSVTSSDGGTTWSSPLTIIADPSFVADNYHVEQTPTGTHIHVGYSNSTATPDEFYYTRSTNGGTSYTTPIAVSTDHDDAGFQPAIFLDGSDVLMIFVDGSMNYAQVKSTNNGDSFGGQTEIHDGSICDAFEDFGNVERYTQDKSDPSTIYITCTGNGGTDNFYMKSTDFGDSWSSPLSTTGSDGFSSFEPNINADGNHVVVVSNVFNGTFTKQIVRTSEDAGSTWSSEELSCSGVCELPSINAQDRHIRVEGGFVWLGYTDIDPISTLRYNFKIFDSTPPVISAIGSEPIQLTQNASVDLFDFVQCVDDVDGTIPDGANFALDGGLTVDTAILKSQSQSFTCTDTATNNSIEVIDFFVNRESSGGGVSADTTAPSIPPPLFTPPSEAPSEVERAFSLFDTLNSLLDFDRTPTQQVTPPEPEPPVPTPEPPDQRVSFIDRLRSFFSGLFG